MPVVIDGTKLDLETLMDAFAYVLQTDNRTKQISWILGDVGMGVPSRVPFGYISVLSEAVGWYSAQGNGAGGLEAGLDDWQLPIMLTVAHEPHRFVPPIVAKPGTDNPDNPFAPAHLGGAVTYLEQPGWRKSLQTTQSVKKVLRTNITIDGAATDTRVVESRYMLQSIGDQLYRATRISIATQQRRVRGN